MNDAKIEQIIKKHKGDASALVQVLQDIQRENSWLSKEILEKVSRDLDVPLSRVQRVATFYKSFSVAPEGHHKIHVCNGTGCHVRGAPRLVEKIQDIMGVRAGEADPDLKISLETVNCLGCCSSGPVMIVDGKYHSRVAPDNAGGC